ncbi:MAG: hypothetical protein QOI66_1667, partial [Myxococcales bacterium]|nr:hypothetical protein [Myxococcales bacterium]
AQLSGTAWTRSKVLPYITALGFSRKAGTGNVSL